MRGLKKHSVVFLMVGQVFGKVFST